MADDIASRLAAAAEALREHEVTTRREVDLRQRMAQVGARLAALRAEYATELRDVERLEGWSLARLLAMLERVRDEQLSSERAEAEPALYRLRAAQAYLDAVRRERESVRARLAELAVAPATFAALLEEKERWLMASGDPRVVRLLELADQRGRLIGELREIDEALRVAGYAVQALSPLQAGLGDPASWPAGGLWTGPRPFGSASIRSRIDGLARMAASADQCLGVLRTELADVSGVELPPPGMVPPLASGLDTKFVDVWLGDAVPVRDRIRSARQHVDRCLWLVYDVQGRLARRGAAARAWLAQLDGERRILLTGTAG